MAKSSGQKLKLLYIIKVLSEETDEQHCISTKELIEKLEFYGIAAERKSIYSDIEALTEFGYDIIQKDNRNGGGYYLASRDFELAELKLLVDAVQSSRFITLKKSRELIKKLEQLTNRYDAGKLQRQVFVAGRVKTENESIYYHVDALHRAIQENKKISFQYLEWNDKKELVPRKGGRLYKVSPRALLWVEEKYYLVAWDEESDSQRHYRVDKMAEVALLEEKGCYPLLNGEMGQEVAAYANRTFGMYGGDEEIVTLAFSERLVGVVIDRFGKEITLRKDNNRIRTRVKVAVSDQFYGWLLGIGSEIEIIAPERIREEFVERLEIMRDIYK